MRRFTAFVLGLCLSLPVLAEQVQRFGDLDVHYNVFNSSFLQPNVASAVGLVRSKAQGVINVVPMEKGKPVEAAVTGSGQDLTGKVIPWSSAESARKAPSTTWRNSRSASARPWSSPSRSRPRANLRKPSVSTRKSSRTNDQARTAGAGQPQCRQTQGTPGHARRQREGALDRRVQPGGTGGNRSFLRRERHPQGTQRRTPLRLPALADDSGLAVDFLGGAPGIYSARYADGRGDAANNAKLLEAMKDVPDAERGAQFVSVLALVRHADDPLPILCEGIWEGRILREARGAHGFGYDPLFWVPERDCSSAELAPEEKNRLSHRARAMALLKQRLGL